MSRLIGHYSYGLSANSSKTNDDIFCKFCVDFKKAAFICNNFDNPVHIVGFIRIFRHKAI